MRIPSTLLRATPATAFAALLLIALAIAIAPGLLHAQGAPAREPIGQTRRTLENIKRIVEMSGTTMANVLRCGVFLTDGADFQAMNVIYREFFPVSPPARTTVVVKALVAPEGKIEIDCVAAMPAR